MADTITPAMIRCEELMVSIAEEAAALRFTLSLPFAEYVEFVRSLSRGALTAASASNMQVTITFKTSEERHTARKILYWALLRVASSNAQILNLNNSTITQLELTNGSCILLKVDKRKAKKQGKDRS
jgi:hypothetical protein